MHLKSTVVYQPDLSLIEQLKNSPIHGLQPIDEREVDLSLIDTDPTNPGADEYSHRYERRWASISESFDIIGGPVYPLVICEHPSKPGRYLTVDGHGRGDEARRRGFKKVRSLIFPKLSLEQRICLRVTLNAAQAPFDTPLVLKDLQLLARERGLDIRNDKHLHALLVDLPLSVRKHQDKLKLLTKWPADVGGKIGVDDDDEAGVVGYDKVKELDGLVNIVRRGHPDAAASYPEDQLYRQVLRMYFDGAFRDGRRSQDTIRDARKLIKKLPQDHALVKRFLKGGLTFSDFAAEAEPNIHDSAEHDDLTPLCKRLNALLTDIDAHNLTAAERRSLKRTADLASQVLVEVDS
ncbi:MAG TPA: hypothetical protein VKC60_16970 [Opitutaceae bacterium]|nr:hypothetical protein [Opitutaceae bacterium]